MHGKLYSEYILTDQEKCEKVTKLKYLGQTTHLKDTTNKEIHARIRAAWSCFGKTKKYLRIDNSLCYSKNFKNESMYLTNNDLLLPNES